MKERRIVVFIEWYRKKQFWGESGQWWPLPNSMTFNYTPLTIFSYVRYAAFLSSIFFLTSPSHCKRVMGYCLLHESLDNLQQIGGELAEKSGNFLHFHKRLYSISPDVTYYLYSESVNSLITYVQRRVWKVLNSGPLNRFQLSFSNWLNFLRMPMHLLRF